MIQAQVDHDARICLVAVRAILMKGLGSCSKSCHRASASCGQRLGALAGRVLGSMTFAIDLSALCSGVWRWRGARDGQIRLAMPILPSTPGVIVTSVCWVYCAYVVVIGKRQTCLVGFALWHGQQASRSVPWRRSYTGPFWGSLRGGGSPPVAIGEQEVPAFGIDSLLLSKRGRVERCLTILSQIGDTCVETIVEHAPPPFRSRSPAGSKTRCSPCISAGTGSIGVAFASTLLAI